MTNSPNDEIMLSDLLPVIDVAAERLPDIDQVRSIASDSRVRKVRYPTGQASEIELWRAVFVAALDEKPETLEKLLSQIRRALGRGSKEELKVALGEVGSSCISRITREAYADLGDQADVLLDATSVTEMEAASQTLRQTALSVRRLLMRPVLGEACIKIAPSVLDPARRRMELADLAVDVVTASDYLLSLLGAPVTTSSPLMLEREAGSDRGHGPLDDDARDRLMRRRLDARAVAVRLGMRLLEGLHVDITNIG